jgi:hypothetical protein
MLLEKFLDTISRVFPSDVLAGREMALSKLNPDKIYVETVRSVLGVSHDFAVRICETAVRQGFFRRGIEVLCPNGSAVAAVEKETDIPAIVHCLGEHGEDDEVSTDSLKKITFYSINEQSSSIL